VVNPPFGFEATARTIVGWLQPLLANGAVPAARAHWLVPE
jgi:23S rRNA A2030 N6-methylase RlmJ